MRNARKVSSTSFFSSFRRSASARFLAAFDLAVSFDAFDAAFLLRGEVDFEAEAFLRVEV